MDVSVLFEMKSVLVNRQKSNFWHYDESNIIFDAFCLIDLYFFNCLIFLQVKTSSKEMSLAVSKLRVNFLLNMFGSKNHWPSTHLH